MRPALLIAALLSAPAPAADWVAKVVPDTPPLDALTKPVRAALGKDAIEVRDAAGKPVVTVWLVPKFPVRATAEQAKNGLTAREIPPGTLVGAARFPAAFTDYRKQDVPAGVYTLRTAIQPETGDHAGTAPHGEFLLLTPAGDDVVVDPVEADDLVKRSKPAAGGDHPAVVLLWPRPGKPHAPSIVSKPGGVKVLCVARPADGAAGTLGLGLTVAGHSATR